MASASLSLSGSRVHCNWIIDRKNDLIWYIGSALAGWLYVVIILYAVTTAQNPLTDALGTLRLGGLEIPLTLQLLVVWSWMFLLDAPHVWATLARTYLDPDEWQVRRSELLRSWGWFVLGPAAISLPYFLGAALAPFGIKLTPFWLGFGAMVYFVFFRLWAYYHVVRQHWGFLQLYKRRNNDLADARENQIDTWFFNLSLYLPLAMFMTSSYYANTPGYPDLGLRYPLFGGYSIGSLVYPMLWGLYLACILAYIGWQWRRWQTGAALNGAKLLFLFSILPLHFVAFAHPMLVIFVVPLVTVGHNLQYHRIVWSYGQNKYRGEQRPGFGLAKKIFSSLPFYILTGLFFTFALYRGPWIDLLRDTFGLQLDQSLLNSIAMMAGIVDPAKLNLGEKIFAAMIAGWAMQHYYLDAKIWRVRRDAMVRKGLGME
ncbi:MAG: hypothetical protein ONA90_04765 [candidate division KSB1 bacterium]|nr:hypothetical protein [candidate division KSB1 bacterium]